MTLDYLLDLIEGFQEVCIYINGYTTGLKDARDVGDDVFIAGSDTFIYNDIAGLEVEKIEADGDVLIIDLERTDS